MTEICTRYAAGPDSPMQHLYDACPDCGHTNIAHPSMANPAIEQCQICLLAVALEEFRDAGQSWLNMIANTLAAPILEHTGDEGLADHVAAAFDNRCPHVNDEGYRCSLRAGHPTSRSDEDWHDA